MPPSPPVDRPDEGHEHKWPGMNDVARLAGVSQKTASRVINDERHVSARIRSRILRAAQELGYRRDTAARAPILRFIHNWSWNHTTLQLPHTTRDVLDGTTHQPGDRLTLNPWDVHVLVEVR